MALYNGLYTCMHACHVKVLKTVLGIGFKEPKINVFTLVGIHVGLWNILVVNDRCCQVILSGFVVSCNKFKRILWASSQNEHSMDGLWHWWQTFMKITDLSLDNGC